MKQFVFFLAAFLVFTTLSQRGQAYIDEILTTREEVWLAVRSAISVENIRSEDSSAYILETRWIEDIVQKQKNVLPSAIGQEFIMPSTVRRRYRMTVQLNELPTGTQIQITGKYQERAVGAPEHQSRWKYVQPSTEDYELERVLFFRILSEMARVRTSEG